MNLKEFEYSYESAFNPTRKTTYGINVLTCSAELLERFLDGKTILEKLLELGETSEFISNMYNEYGGSYTIVGAIVFQIDYKTQCEVTVSHDDFMDFAEIVNTLEGL